MKFINTTLLKLMREYFYFFSLNLICFLLDFKTLYMCVNSDIKLKQTIHEGLSFMLCLEGSKDRKEKNVYTRIVFLCYFVYFAFHKSRPANFI